MKTCSHCGGNVEDGALFCPHCAYSLNTPRVQTTPVQKSQEQSPPVEMPPVETQRIQTAPIEAPPVETQPIQTIPVQTPRIQMPAVQTPRIQMPAVQTPRIQMPAVQTPRLQTTPQRKPPISANTTGQNSEPINELSRRLKTNGYIWILLSVFEFLIGIGVTYFLAIGVIYLIVGFRSLSSSKKVFENPSGIVEKYRPVAGTVMFLIFNFIFSGIIGIIGSIHYLASVRNYVMSNSARF